MEQQRTQGPGLMRRPIFGMGFGHNAKGENGVVFVIARDSFIETAEGDPSPGIWLSPADAREAAYALLLHAQQIENGCSIGMSLVQNPTPTAA